jgi:hypothetical protein
MRAGTTAIAATLAFGPPAAPALAGSSPRPEGPPALVADWPAKRIADGLTVYRGVLGDPSREGRWTITVRQPGPGHPYLGDAEDAGALADRLREAGYRPRIDEIDWGATAGGPALRLGRRIRIGSYGSRADAEAAVKELKAEGFRGVADWTGRDTSGTDEDTPPSARMWVIVLDPRRYRGRVAATYGASLAGRETTTAMARAAGAPLAVNGGYFVMKGKDGIPGAPAGIGVYGGRLLGAATNGRVALLLDGMRIARLRTKVTVRAGGASRAIDGIDRRPGRIRDCGGVGGDEPTERPRHDVTCTDRSEIVLFTPELGRRTPRVHGVEVVLDRSGRVVGRRRPGGEVPRHGRVLSGIGAGARWLSAHARRGSRVTIEERIVDQDGAPVDVGRSGPVAAHPIARHRDGGDPADGVGGGDVINGGPWLVHDGRIYLDVAADGVYYPENPGFLYNWGIRRKPRTMLGVDAGGRVIVVVADGQRPGYSDGLSLREGARLMRDLGAVEAISLDSGGSVTLAVHGELANRPSDATGERPIGDALLFLPAAAREPG